MTPLRTAKGQHKASPPVNAVNSASADAVTPVVAAHASDTFPGVNS